MRSQMEQRNVMVKEQVQKKVTDDKKKIRDVFKDFTTESFALYNSLITSINIFKKSGKLETSIEAEKQIKILDLIAFERYIEKRFGFKETIIKIEYIKLPPFTIIEEWKNIIEYIAYKYPLAKALLMGSIVNVDGNNVNINLALKGKDILDKEIKKIGMSHSDLFKPEWIQVVLNRYNYNTVEDMYASIGFGGISPNKIITRLLEEYKKEHEEDVIEEKIQELVTEKPRKTKSPKSGVIVKGVDNCLVKFSKCCNPVPGDDIIGYITKGRGVSIHRKDCPNLKDLLSEEERIIEVEWFDQTEKAEYNVDIQILANDRTGLLSDVVREITNQKINIMGVNTRTSKDRIATIDATLEVQDIGQLNQVLKQIRKVDSVYDVTRKN